MLPDYPELKRELRADLNLQLRLVVNMSAPLASRIRSYHQAEGDRFTYETTEGKLITKRFLRMAAKLEVHQASPRSRERHRPAIRGASVFHFGRGTQAGRQRDRRGRSTVSSQHDVGWD